MSAECHLLSVSMRIQLLTKSFSISGPYSSLVDLGIIGGGGGGSANAGGLC